MKIYKLKYYPLLFVFIALFAGFQPNPKLVPGEGYAEVTGGKIWYRIIGEGDETPILLLHGGPEEPVDRCITLQNFVKKDP